MSTSVSTIPASKTAEQPKIGSSWLKNLYARVEDSDFLSSIVAISDQAMLSGTNFVTAVIIGRSCGAETLGVYSLVASAIAMIVGLQDQLVTAPYVVYHNRRQGKAHQRYTGSILVHHLVFMALILAGMIACTASVWQSSELIRLVTIVLLIGTPAILLHTFIRELCLAHCEMLTVLLLDAVICITRLAVVIALFATDSVNLPAIYGVMGVAALFAVVVWMQRNRSRFLFRRKSIMVDWLRNWCFGRWALATHVAGTSTPYLMPWVLFLMHGEAATGYLASCSVIVGVCNIMLAGMCDFLNPRTARAYTDGGIPQLRIVQRQMLALIAFTIGSVCVIAAMFGEQIIHTLYDGQFPGTGVLVIWLTLSVLANAIGLVAGSGLWAIDQPRANFVADMVTLTVAVAAAPALVGPYGALGAAIATFAASACGAICRQLIFHQAAREITGAKAQAA